MAKTSPETDKYYGLGYKYNLSSEKAEYRNCSITELNEFEN